MALVALEEVRVNRLGRSLKADLSHHWRAVTSEGRKKRNKDTHLPLLHRHISGTCASTTSAGCGQDRFSGRRVRLWRSAKQAHSPQTTPQGKHGPAAPPAGIAPLRVTATFRQQGVKERTMRRRRRRHLPLPDLRRIVALAALLHDSRRDRPINASAVPFRRKIQKGAG